MNTLSEIMKTIKERKGVATLNVGSIDPRVRGNFEANAREAALELPHLSIKYFNSFREQAQFVLVDSALSAEVISDLKEKKVILVDAQEFYQRVARNAQGLSPDRVLTITSFVELTNSLAALSRATNFKMPTMLQFEEGDAALTLEENIRNIVRKQFGKSGAEPAWVIANAVEQAMSMGVEGDIVPVVVYNLLGNSSQEYNVFNNLMTVDTEVASASDLIDTIKDNLVKQGKIQPKKSSKKNKQEEK